MTPTDIAKLRELSRGFDGRFEFRPAHTEDRGIGNIADYVDVDDQLVFVPSDQRVEDDHYVISDCVEQHVAEPLVELLNAAPDLLDEIERLQSAPPIPEHLTINMAKVKTAIDGMATQLAATQAALDEACDIAVSWSGPDTVDGERISQLRTAGRVK